MDNSCDAEEFNRLTVNISRFLSPKLDVQIHAANSNLGYAGGNNLAWRKLLGELPEVVIVINPDVEMTKGSLRCVLEAVRANSHFIFGALTTTEGEEYSGLGRLDPRSGQSHQLTSIEASEPDELIYPSGHFLALSSKLWTSLNGMSEDYFLYSEEIDLTLRARGLYGDVQVATLENVNLEHFGGLTTGSGPGLQKKSLATYLHGTRSRVILFRKHPGLRKYLPLIVGARVAWSMKVWGSAGFPSAQAIWIGLAQGFAWRKSAEIIGRSQS
jgi:GT2 family glycosyltransferase